MQLALRGVPSINKNHSNTVTVPVNEDPLWLTSLTQYLQQQKTQGRLLRFFSSPQVPNWDGGNAPNFTHNQR